MALIGRDVEVEAVPSSRPMSEPPPSGPVSGVVGRSLFQSDAGPGYWLGDDGLVTLSFAGDAFPPSKVVRFGPDGLWFVRAPNIDYRLQTRVQVHLKFEDGTIGPLAARIVQLDARGRGPVLGLKLSPLATGTAREVLSKLNQLVVLKKAKPAVTGMPLREEILERQRIVALLSTFAGTEEWGQTAEPSSRVQVAAVVQEGLVRWRVDGEMPSGTFVAELRGYNSIYRVHLAVVGAWKDGIVTPLPARVERLRHRQFRRGKLNSGWTVEFLHPLWDLPVIRREVRDISFGGVCFVSELDEDLVLPGLRLPLIKVVGPDEQSVQLHGQVRFVQPGENGQSAVCGVSVEPSLAEDEDLWTQLVLRMLNQNTESGVEWADGMWELFTESGYFNLSGKTPVEFDELKRNFVAVADRTTAEVRLSCQAVWPSSRGVEASCSVLKAYDGTWMLHQVAKRRGFRAQGSTPHVLRDIYLRSFEHAQADPGFRWAVSYVEASVPWMQRSHIAFAERHDPERAMALPFRLMEAVCSDREASGTEFFDIGEMTDFERRLFLGVVAESCPRPYIEALDLVPPRLQLDGTATAWGQASLERGRTMLVARRGAVAVAAAVLETGEIGTNLFRLLDSVRLFSLRAGGEEAYAALLETSKKWYAEQGRESFVYFWEDLKHAEHVRVARLRDLGEGRFWAVSADLLPEFLEFVFELTARKPTYNVPAGHVVSMFREQG